MVGTLATAALPEGNRPLDPISVLSVRNRKGDTLVDNTDPRINYALDPEYAYMITDILSKDENRQITYGRGSNLNIPGHRVAVKTGTSEPYEKSKLIGDTWTLGYTPGIAVGVWVGNSNNEPMTNIFSTTIAGSTWHDTIIAALEGKEARDWVKPAGIIEATVCVPSGLRPVQGQSCPTVTGMFAEQALSRNDVAWWGGQTLTSPAPVNARSIPAEITGWKRTLAEEYLRVYRGGSSRWTSPASQPAPIALTPVVVPQQAPPPPDGGNGNGNGRGPRR